MSDEVDEAIGVREAARIIGVHENTIRNWIASGRLQAVKLAGGRFRRLSRREVERIAARLPEIPDYSPDVDAAYRSGYGAGWAAAMACMRDAATRAMFDPAP